VKIRTIPLDDAAPLVDYVPAAGGTVWLRDGDGFVGWGEAARIGAGTGAERFTQARDALRALAADASVDDPLGLPGSGLVAFGSFTFDPQSAGSVLVVPEVVLARRAGRTWLTVVDDASPELPSPPPPPPPPADRIRYAGSSKPDREWLDAVASALEHIDDGAVEKVVLARDHAVWSKAPFDPRVLVRRLAARFPSCWTFLCDRLVGATPELLVRRTGRRVASIVLAGSAPRDPVPAVDARIGEQLLGAAKDRAEHALAVASVRDALAPRCETLRVDADPWLLRLDNVQHLATSVEATLRAGETALELAAALHPTAAVGGVPTAPAVELIRTLEGMDRGRYSGPVGWVDERGDGEWGIALRCAQLSGARARLFAGAGIVAGSLPEAELEETRVKLRAMQSALER
jgi:menaquinone-specific isochorismate synthase